jgi:quercetin dioxygenase-like cupin family protein
MTLFEKFASGRLVLPEKQIEFDAVEWSKHAIFEGVELKHIDTGGAFSYHLVRIAPGKKIGSHIHKTQLETHEVIGGGGFCMREGKAFVYGQGVISIIPAGIEHEVVAGDRGLYLFAKFIPALC